MSEKFFNVLDEPWLPVRLVNGSNAELGLLDVFRRSGEITALAETAPPNLVAQYRLLLAITHRALTMAFRTWKDTDRARWYRDGLPVDEICAYLEHWRERFWLFHPTHPFMQVAALATADETKDKELKPWTQISLASASGNTPVVFDHAHDAKPFSISSAQAVSTLLGYLQFTPGGLVKTLRDADKAGALANTAAVIPTGENLLQTLCLCLHPALGASSIDDAPAWEREPLTIAELRDDAVLATGPNDRYTRQSRAVLLLREDDNNIQNLRFAAGFALADDANAPDVMASFRAGTQGLVRLTFTEGKALWRDLPAITPSLPGAGTQHAATLNHAITLHTQNSFDTVYQPLLVAGLASDKAKLLRWRAEQLVLPVALLVDADRAQSLCALVMKADELHGELRKLAFRMVDETYPSKDGASDWLKQSPFSTSYFVTAERALPHVMELIANDRVAEADVHWRKILRTSALHAWQQVLNGMGKSARALRADAKYWPRLHGLLNKQVPETETIEATEA